ncbi:hypothetical protein ACGF7W_19705 [Streptomyces sp. NPDC048219]|uniref:hypothetical protein n=1 Tax=Streptomyces sp. NPDC048219 TaxID=3365517 RepID=UPI0037127876
MTETTHQAVAVAEDKTTQRAGLMHAFSEAEQIVSQLRSVPTDVNVRGTDGSYTVHLFFSRHDHGSQGVLEFAQTFDAEVTSAPSMHIDGVYLEARTRVHGVPALAWTVADQAPDPDEPRERTADEDPITYALTPEGEALATAEAVGQ